MNDLNLLDQLPQAAKRSSGEVVGHWLLLSVLAVGFLSTLLVWSLLRMFPNELMMLVHTVFMGVFLAFPFFPGIVLTLLDAPLGLRAGGLVVSALLYFSVAIFGILISGGDAGGISEVARYVGPAVPLGIGCIAIPFLLARYLLGWQIVMRNWGGEPKLQHISITGLMIATFYIAVCVVALRASPEPIAAFAFCAVIAGIGLIFWILFVHLMLRAKSYWLYLLIFVVVGVAIGLAYSFSMIRFQGAPLELWFVLGPPSIFASGVLWLGLGFIAIRLLKGELIFNSDLVGKSSSLSQAR